MSRIGKQPITLPDKVEVSFEGNTVKVKGPLGEISHTFRPEITFVKEGNVIYVNRKDEERASRSFHGLSRTILNNMVVGVSQGFSKQLEMIGVGYKAQVQGRTLVLSLGYSHPVEYIPPDGVDVSVEGNTKITVKGYDKQKVGQAAANIRSFRKPEPYKGKGVRYQGEQIRRKAGKSGKK